MVVSRVPFVSGRAYLDSMAACRHAIELVHGVEHRHDVLHGRARLHIMNRTKHKTAMLGEDFAALQHLLANLRRGAEGEDLLRVHAAAPEDNAAAVALLQMLGFHSGCRALHRIQDVDAALDKGIDESFNGPTGVLEDFPFRIAMNPVIELLVIREVQLTKRGDGTERGSLRAQVCPAGEDGVHIVADGGMNPLQVADGDRALALEDLMNVTAAAAR